MEALRRFYVYIHMREFTVFTDHCCLRYLKSCRMRNSRLLRWALLINDHVRMNIVHINGKDNHDADCLSRLPDFLEALRVDMFEKKPPLFDDVISFGGYVQCELLVLDTSTTDMAREQLTDPFCQSLLILLRTPDLSTGERKRLDNFFIHQNCLYRKNNSRTSEYGSASLVLPRSLRSQLLEKNHDESGHCGQRSTIMNIRRKYWWPNIQWDVTSHIQACIACLKKKPDRQGQAPSIPPISLLPPARAEPFTHAACDIVVMPTSSNGHKYFLTVICILTRYVVTIALMSVDAETVLEAITDKVFVPFRFPDLLLSDNGLHFAGTFMDGLARVGVKHVLISAYRPNANGITERVQGTIKSRLYLMTGDNARDWDRYLIHATSVYNHSVHKTLRFSPYFLLTGSVGSDRFDLEHEPKITSLPDDLTSINNERVSRLFAARELARTSLINSMQQTAERLNKDRRPKVFKPSDNVMFMKRMVRRDNKFKFVPFSGPYTITRVHRGNTYFIRGNNWEAGVELLVHAFRLKRASRYSKPVNELQYNILKLEVSKDETTLEGNQQPFIN